MECESQSALLTIDFPFPGAPFVSDPLLDTDWQDELVLWYMAETVRCLLSSHVCFTAARPRFTPFMCVLLVVGQEALPSWAINANTLNLWSLIWNYN